MVKHIAITQQGDKTVFMLGDYQANLYPPNESRGWLAEYFKKNRTLLLSDSVDHPPMPPQKGGRARAESIVKEVLSCLDTGTPIPRGRSRTPYLKKVLSFLNTGTPPATRPKRSTRNSNSKVVTAYQVIDRLLNLADDTCTVLVPMGKPTALSTSKVRIVDSEGETICEVPYPIFKTLL